MLSEERIAEIQRLRAGITNQPLYIRTAADGSGDYAVLSNGNGVYVFEKIGDSHIVDTSQLATLITACPAIVDDLLAERRELLDAVEAMNELLHQHHDTSKPVINGCWCPHCAPGGEYVAVLTKVWAAHSGRRVWDSVTTYGAYEKPI